MTAPGVTTRGFTLTRTLDAPREQVFRAWTDPAHLTWFFNDTMPTPSEQIEVDLRVGGRWRVMMVIDDDTRYMTGGRYLEISPPERLVFIWGAAGGWPRLDLDNLDDNPIVTVDLAEEDADQTRMTVMVSLPERMSDERAAEWLASGMRNGWSDTIDRLVAKMR
jgi:uncharacterized protein YndB with AHSA1/START domain